MEAEPEWIPVHVKAFIEKASFPLAVHYPSWKDGNPNEETTCIPDMLDLSKGYLGQVPEGKIQDFTRAEYLRVVESGETGTAGASYGGFELDKLAEGFNPSTYEKALKEVRKNWAEQLSLNLIRADKKLGGYLLLDVNSEILIKTILNSSLETSKTERAQSSEVLSHCKRHYIFQTDLLLMHPKYGIVSFEVKFGDTVGTEKQVRRHRSNLMNFVQTIFGGTRPLPPVTLVICCPNHPIGDNITSEDGQIHKIGLEHCQSPRAFHQRMQKIIESQEAGNGANWFTEPVFQQLFVLFVGYRSAQFICHATSSLEIYRLINSQAFAKHLKGYKEVSMPLRPNSGGEMETIFLSPQQLRILENPVQHQVIWGAPGSGKTLLVMQKVLHWCQQDGPGDVVVLTHSKTLNAKYDHFFKACQEHGIEFKRQPTVQIVTSTRVPSTLNSTINSGNDVALDEGGIIMESELVALFEGQLAGKRFLALTGNFFAPHFIGKQSTAVLPPGKKPSQPVVTELRTIFRGTVNIIDEWRKHFRMGYGEQLTVAHNIAGSPVREIKVCTPEQMMFQVRKCIDDAVCGANRSEMHFSDIALLCDYVDESISAALRKHGIKSQSIKDSVQNPESGALIYDHYGNSLSYEWKTVIAVGRSGKTMLIPSSRAIASLYVVYFDHNDYEIVLADDFERSYGTQEPNGLDGIKEVTRRTYESKGWGEIAQELLEGTAVAVRNRLDRRSTQSTSQKHAKGAAPTDKVD